MSASYPYFLEKIIVKSNNPHRLKPYYRQIKEGLGQSIAWCLSNQSTAHDIIKTLSQTILATKTLNPRKKDHKLVSKEEEERYLRKAAIQNCKFLVVSKLCQVSSRQGKVLSQKNWH